MVLRVMARIVKQRKKKKKKMGVEMMAMKEVKEKREMIA